jgi:hypothetical protein
VRGTYQRCKKVCSTRSFESSRGYVGRNAGSEISRVLGRCRGRVDNGCQSIWQARVRYASRTEHAPPTVSRTSYERQCRLTRVCGTREWFTNALARSARSVLEASPQEGGCRDATNGVCESSPEATGASGVACGRCRCGAAAAWCRCGGELVVRRGRTTSDWCAGRSRSSTRRRLLCEGTHAHPNFGRGSLLRSASSSTAARHLGRSKRTVSRWSDGQHKCPFADPLAGRRRGEPDGVACQRHCSWIIHRYRATEPCNPLPPEPERPFTHVSRLV